ncbi:Cytochrome P450 93A3 [Senna tora]|uniref:Cytochrome P450 93A3 n=1 Tax=Senna tora TaxID=362788 RepID=A0A834T1Y1_9FABA|nr:Cytochrome P450 93A3 [Senna tora]
MRLCFFQQKTEEPHGLCSAHRVEKMECGATQKASHAWLLHELTVDTISPKEEALGIEVFGSVRSESNETRDRVEEELEDGSVGRGYGRNDRVWEEQGGGFRLEGGKVGLEDHRFSSTAFDEYGSDENREE